MTRLSTSREIEQAVSYAADAFDELTAYLQQRYPDLSKHHAIAVSAAIIGALPSLYEENRDSELDSQLERVVADYIAEISPKKGFG